MQRILRFLTVCLVLRCATTAYPGDQTATSAPSKAVAVSPCNDKPCGACSGVCQQYTLPDPPGYNRNHKRLSCNTFGLDKYRSKKECAKSGGQIVKYTVEKGRDTRIYSQVLCRKRDLYVYLPPGYDSSKCYPLILFLHGAFGDEHAFLSGNVLNTYDKWVREGKACPMIIACPDGTNDGTSRFTSQHSFYVNGNAGRFEDHLMQEVIPFLSQNFSIRPEREAHAICGVSAGAYGALYLGIKYSEYFSATWTLAPPANVRYWNSKERYFRNFRPEEYRWQNTYRPNLIVGNFMNLLLLRAKRLLDRSFGPAEEVFDKIIVTNPADVLFQLDMSKHPLDIYINCPSHDNFNFDAQSESFQWLAKCQGVDVKLEIEPMSQHLPNYFNRTMPVLYYHLSHKLLPATECQCLIGKTWASEAKTAKK